MTTYRNSILRNLDPTFVTKLALRPVTLEVNHEIGSPGVRIGELIFLEQGVASATICFHDSSQVEVGIYGIDSIVGVTALFGIEVQLQRIYMQIAGNGFALDLAVARREFTSHRPFSWLAQDAMAAQWSQVNQSVACNARHSIEQRLARWLLLCADRAGVIVYSVSQEFLANMLGVSRPRLSVAAATLKSAGLLSYSRGTVHIRDLAGLERRACECYGMAKHNTALLKAT